MVKIKYSMLFIGLCGIFNMRVQYYTNIKKCANS